MRSKPSFLVSPTLEAMVAIIFQIAASPTAEGTTPLLTAVPIPEAEARLTKEVIM